MLRLTVPSVWLRKLYHMRLITGLVLSLPSLVLSSWLSWTAYHSLLIHQRFTALQSPIDLALFQVSLHDTLQHNWQVLQQHLSPHLATTAASDLPSLHLRVSEHKMAKFSDQETQPFVSGKMTVGKHTYKMEVRLRGQRHWHIAGSKKSLKVKLTDGFYQGVREFNLNAPNTPFLLEEQLYFKWARQAGLLTPEVGFVNVILNGVELGVYHFKTAVDEGVLRTNQRFPGNIYVFEPPKHQQFEHLWLKAKYWQQVEGDGKSAKKDPLLNKLLNQIESTSDKSLAEFIEHQLDLRAFAKLEALNQLLGADLLQNYALYFDPYKGLWEPLPFEFEGFRHQAHVQLATTPLVQRLQNQPLYRQMYLQALQQWLKELPPETVAAEANQQMANLLPALSHDPFWQSTHLLPDLGPSHTHLLRPMNLQKLAQATQSSLNIYRQRYQSLQTQLALQQVSPALKQQVLPPKTVVKLGPGPISLHQTQVFGPTQQVWVAPGTTFYLAPQVSLVFYGQVKFAGTAAQPIEVRPLNATGKQVLPQQRWGGLVVQGPSSHGSSLSHVNVWGGTRPEILPGHRQITYPGTLNFHATADLSIKNCLFRDNAVADDLVHMAYVKKLIITNSQIQNSFSDAWDLEFSQGVFKHNQVLQAGDDCLDLMGSQLQVTHSRLLYCKGNGISAGEESQLQLSESLIAQSNVGLLSKNASLANTQKSLFWKNTHALRIYQRSNYYAIPSRLQAGPLVLEGTNLLKKDTESEGHYQISGVTHPRVQPQKWLQPLLQELRVTSWQTLEAWLQQQRTLAAQRRL